MTDLTGTVVLVTGAGRGIGAAVARGAVRAGARAVLHDLDLERGAGEIEAEFGAKRCHVVAGDLADPAAIPALWQAAVAWRGRVDVLVNNAGIYEPAAIEDPFERWRAAWQRTLDINLVAPAALCREAITHFRGLGGGIIVNVASRAAFRGDDAEYMHYAASKAGLVALTRTIARHYGRQGITAFAVAPGFVRTSLNEGVFREIGAEAVARDIPLGAIAEPEDVAHVVLFLASGLARHATGTTVDINGASYVR